MRRLRTCPSGLGVPSRPLAGLVLGAMVLTGFGASAAERMCNAPLDPVCATDTVTLSGSAARARCAQDIARHAEQMEDYVSCLEGNLESARQGVKKSKALRDCLKEGTDMASCKEQAEER